MATARQARGAQVWQQRGEEADQREIGTDLEDELDALAIGHGAEHGGADAAESEGKAEEEAGHCAHFAGDELLRVNEDGREGEARMSPMIALRTAHQKRFA